jgi:hypothetical protein
MANDCLVTKLKGVVDNPNLPKMGEFKIEIGVKPNVTAPFWIQSTGEMNITIEGDGHFYKGTYDAQTDVTTQLSNTSNTTGYRVSEGNSVIKITPKYGITNITLNSAQADLHTKLSFDMDDLQFNTHGLEVFNCMNIEDAPYHYHINLDKIKFGALRVFNDGSSNIEGNIVNIARAMVHTAGNSFTIGGGAKVSKPITGSIEEFVEAVTPDGYGISIRLRPCGPTLKGVVNNYTLSINIDDQGDAVVTKNLDSSVLATYSRSLNSWTYNF